MLEEHRQAFLEGMLERVIRWLEYSERKNAVLLAFLGAFIAVLLRAKNGVDICGYVVLVYYSSLLGFVVSSLITLLSFVPQLDLDGGLGHAISRFRVSRRTPDLLYFGYAAQINKEMYCRKLHELFDISPPFSKLEIEIVNQIWINSRIVDKKMRLFGAGSRLAIFSSCGGLISLMLI